MPKQEALNPYLAALWGAFATWIFYWLDVPATSVVFWACEPAVKNLLQDGWTTDQIRPYVVWAADVLPAPFYGLLFGFPLGLLRNRSIIVTWGVFVAAFLATIAVRILLVNVDYLVGNFVSPLYWPTLLATLLFLYLGNRVRSAYVIHRTAA
jgi:hypothetical protein